LTTVLNGCSFGLNWHPFPGVNLSKDGGSIYRSIRTTVEYVAAYGPVDWVLIPLTFVNRFEISRINEENDPIEGSYVIDGEFDYNKINAQISDTCYKEWDYAFLNIALFAGWLDNQGIKYLIWDQCNNFNPDMIRGFPGIEKQKFVRENKRVIPILNFCANQYMYENGGEWFEHDSDKEPYQRHYKPEAFAFVKEYLDKYAKDVLNETIDWKSNDE
tara:strand:+ start:1635 stop:2282 length:648 start_codon:yes stop_codon:yes gene_type:complete